MRALRKKSSLSLVGGSVLAALLCMLAVVPALAHARYLRSEPGDGAIVSSAPERIEIWFTQELFRRAGENWIRVQNPEGERVELGEAQIDDDDRSRLSVELQPDLAPGSYQVSWRNLSAEDGDSDEGQFSFDYDPQAAATSTPMLEETPAPPPSPTPEPALTAAPEATAVPSPMVAPTAEPDGGGCGIGLAPVAGLIGFAVPAALRKRARA